MILLQIRKESNNLCFSNSPRQVDLYLLVFEFTSQSSGIIASARYEEDESYSRLIFSNTLAIDRHHVHSGKIVITGRILSIMRAPKSPCDLVSDYNESHRGLA